MAHRLGTLLISTFVPAFASSIPGAPRACGGDRIEFPVRVYNLAAVHAADLARALGLAGAIFGRAGIRLNWENADPSSSEALETDFGRARYRPGIHSGPLAIRVVESAPAGLPAGALGFSLPFARRGIDVTIFADRALAVWRNTQASYSRIIGYALAHEIGHVLLRSSAHSQAGLMRASWSMADWRRISLMELAFSAAECARMRETLVLRRNAMLQG